MGRYIIYGAGAVGALIGARLNAAGREVALIARGGHGEALARDGLRLRTPDGDQVARLPVAGEPGAFSITAEDTVVLTMKTQHCAAAVRALAEAASPRVTVVCAENGLEGERLALRLFEHVYGAYVFVYAALAAPGVATCYSAPAFGLIDVGRYPGGADDRAQAIAADLRAAGFLSEAQADVMALKRGKLLVNLFNAAQAACGAAEGVQEIGQAARAEGERCFRAAGLPFVDPAELLAKGAAQLPPGTIDGQPFPGGSTLQGMARGAPDSEADYLNGEIVLLGRSHGVSTPINAALQQVMRELVATRAAPGSMTLDELRRRIGLAGG